MNNNFPVTHSKLSVTTLMADVLISYGIGTPMECKLLNSGLNDTYLVKTQAGTYILRAYRTGWRSLSDIHYELDALLHLDRRGVPVSVPVPRKDGELMHIIQAPEGPRPLVLFTYAPGKAPIYEADHESEAYRYGRTVAQIHTETDDFHSQHQRFALDLEHLLDAPLKAIEPQLLYRPDDWKVIRTLAEKLRHQIQNIPAKELARGFCHGDFHGGNAHAEHNGQITFFDFDCCGYGWRAYDMAVFCWNARARGIDKKVWPHFLKGYREVRPIGEADQRAIPYFIAIRHIWYLGLHAANGQDWGFGWMDDRYYDRAMKFFREWNAENEENEAT